MFDQQTTHRLPFNPHAALRGHRDQLSPYKQVESAAVETQLPAERYEYREPEIDPSLREFLRAATD